MIANSLGAAFGNYLVRSHGFRWGVIIDEQGEEYAVKHLLGNTVAYPVASVEKRIARREPDFFQSVYALIIDQLRRAETNV